MFKTKKVFVIEGYNDEFKTLDKAISWNLLKGFCTNNVVYEKKYSFWNRNKFSLNKLGTVLELSKTTPFSLIYTLYINNHYETPQKEAIYDGGGFQNSGGYYSDGMSGFRG